MAWKVHTKRKKRPKKGKDWVTKWCKERLFENLGAWTPAGLWHTAIKFNPLWKTEVSKSAWIKPWVLTQLLNIIDKGFTKAESQIYIILMEIPSWPCDLLMFKALIILMISLSSKTIKESLSLVTKIDWLGHSLPLLKGVHR